MRTCIRGGQHSYYATLSGEAKCRWCGRGGDTFSQTRDGTRLNAQHRRVMRFMADGEWHTLSSIAEATGDPEASVSARLRDLRKVRFGNYLVERRHIARGQWEYRVPRLAKEGYK